MLEEVTKEKDNMIVFRDLNGDIWQIVKREDFSNFDELIQTTSSESESVDDHHVMVSKRDVITGLDQI